MSKKTPLPLGTPSPQEQEELVDLRRRVSMLEADVSGLRRAVQQFDYDLQDAVDGFYRRRQSDRMREIREVEVKKKPLSWQEIQKRAMARLAGVDLLSGDTQRAEETPTETSTNQG